MKKFLALIVSWPALVSADIDPAVKLYELRGVPIRSAVCGCEFNRSVAGVKEGSIGSGPTVLVIDLNGKPPNVRINLGMGNVRVPAALPIKFPLYECSPGKAWASAWRSSELSVDVRLIAHAAGAEACWFSGEVRVERGAARTSARIKGACGC